MTRSCRQVKAGDKHTQTGTHQHKAPDAPRGTRNRKASQLQAGYEGGGGGEVRMGAVGRGLSGAGCAKRPQWEI